MATISDARIALAALRAGFPADEIATAVAMALAESDGNPSAINQNTDAHRSRDYGLWQINGYWWRDLFNHYSPWSDPDVNGRMAHQVWSESGQSWSPWVTFQREMYVKYLARGQDAYRSLYRFTLRRYLFNHPQARSKDQLDHGSDVLALQRAIGMAHGDQDSYFGPLTARHVGQFQQKVRIARDEVVGPVTCKKLGWGWGG